MSRKVILSSIVVLVMCLASVFSIGIFQSVMNLRDRGEAANSCSMSCLDSTDMSYDLARDYYMDNEIFYIFSEEEFRVFMGLRDNIVYKYFFHDGTHDYWSCEDWFDYFNGKTVVLCCDIDGGGAEIHSCLEFKGEFDGQYHTVKNYKISGSKRSGSDAYVGLVEELYGEIGYLRLTNIDYFYTYEKTSKPLYVAGFAGIMYAGSRVDYCAIEYCDFDYTGSASLAKIYICGVVGVTDYGDTYDDYKLAPVIIDVYVDPIGEINKTGYVAESILANYGIGPACTDSSYTVWFDGLNNLFSVYYRTYINVQRCVVGVGNIDDIANPDYVLNYNSSDKGSIKSLADSVYHENNRNLNVLENQYSNVVNPDTYFWYHSERYNLGYPYLQGFMKDLARYKFYLRPGCETMGIIGSESGGSLTSSGSDNFLEIYIPKGKTLNIETSNTAAIVTYSDSADPIVTAQPNAGYEFDKWELTYEGRLAGESITTKEFQAWFSLEGYDIYFITSLVGGYSSSVRGSDGQSKYVQDGSTDVISYEVKFNTLVTCDMKNKQYKFKDINDTNITVTYELDTFSDYLYIISNIMLSSPYHNGTKQTPNNNPSYDQFYVIRDGYIQPSIEYDEPTDKAHVIIGESWPNAGYDEKVYDYYKYIGSEWKNCTDSVNTEYNYYLYPNLYDYINISWTNVPSPDTSDRESIYYFEYSWDGRYTYGEGDQSFFTEKIRYVYDSDRYRIVSPGPSSVFPTLNGVWATSAKVDFGCGIAPTFIKVEDSSLIELRFCNKDWWGGYFEYDTSPYSITRTDTTESPETTTINTYGSAYRVEVEKNTPITWEITEDGRDQICTLTFETYCLALEDFSRRYYTYEIVYRHTYDDRELFTDYTGVAFNSESNLTDIKQGYMIVTEAGDIWVDYDYLYYNVTFKVPEDENGIKYPNVLVSAGDKFTQADVTCQLKKTVYPYGFQLINNGLGSELNYFVNGDMGYIATYVLISPGYEIYDDSSYSLSASDDSMIIQPKVRSTTFTVKFTEPTRDINGITRVGGKTIPECMSISDGSGYYDEYSLTCWNGIYYDIEVGDSYSKAQDSSSRVSFNSEILYTIFEDNDTKVTYYISLGSSTVQLSYKIDCTNMKFYLEDYRNIKLTAARTFTPNVVIKTSNILKFIANSSYTYTNITPTIHDGDGTLITSHANVELKDNDIWLSVNLEKTATVETMFLIDTEQDLNYFQFKLTIGEEIFIIRYDLSTNYNTYYVYDYLLYNGTGYTFPIEDSDLVNNGKWVSAEWTVDDDYEISPYIKPRDYNISKD